MNNKFVSITSRLEALITHYLGENQQNKIEQDINNDMRTFTSPTFKNKLKPSPSYEIEEDDAPEHKATFSSSKEIVPTRIAPINDNNQGPVAPVKNKLSGDKLKSHEVFGYAKYDDVSFASCSSPSGRYSEFALVIWLSSSTTYSQKFRIEINIMHDSKEQLWCVSSSLIKKYSYSSKDEVESFTPNRACSQSELLKELKKTLIYAGLPPKSIHKRFLKLLRKKDIITNISKYGFITTESANHSSLQKKLNESPTSGQTVYGGHNYYGHDYSHDYRRHN